MRRTPRERLAEHLTRLGFRSRAGEYRPRLVDVQPDEIRVPRGYWSQNSQDCYRWEVDLYREEHPTYTAWIASWFTVSVCARRGIRLEEDGPVGLLAYPVETP